MTKKPFFARFLENQMSEEKAQHVGSGTVTTYKYPSDDDEFTTAKYPSDDDEPTTRKYPSDDDEFTTYKYPSDDDEG